MPLSIETMLVRFGVAMICGGIIGFEREYRRKAAGLKTVMLICMGATIFSIVSIGIAPNDPARIAAQVVTGVGFLGAGAIMRGRLGVHGLTTAAIVFVAAGIGVAAGVGQLNVAWAGTGLSLIVLTIARRFESIVGKRGDPIGYVFMTPDPGAFISAMTSLLAPKRLSL